MQAAFAALQLECLRYVYTVHSVAVKLVSGFTTIYTVLIAMTETVKLPVNEAEDGVCDLGLDQIETVKLVLGFNTTMRSSARTVFLGLC